MRAKQRASRLCRIIGNLQGETLQSRSAIAVNLAVAESNWRTIAVVDFRLAARCILRWEPILKCWTICKCAAGVLGRYDGRIHMGSVAATTPARLGQVDAAFGTAMKITAIETRVCHARMRNWIFVKLLTDQPGLFGWGEATLEWHTRSVVGAIEDLACLLIGQDPSRVEHLPQPLRHHRGLPLHQQRERARHPDARLRRTGDRLRDVRRGAAVHRRGARSSTTSPSRCSASCAAGRPRCRSSPAA